jgi:acetyl esterase
MLQLRDVSIAHSLNRCPKLPAEPAIIASHRRERSVEPSDRRRFCLGLGAFTAALHLRAFGEQTRADGEPELLQRPASGLGSQRLVDVPIRQRALIYKKTPQGDLSAYVFYPTDWSPQDHRPACGFFFGGGWRTGTPAQFIPEAEYFASRGMVCATFEYRKIGKTGIPDICIADAKSAIRWFRTNATELGVDPQRVVASGGSAGGQLAAATALISAFDDDSSQPPVSCIPDAMVLFNPELDLTGEGFNDASGKSMERELSPIFDLRPHTPPMILFFGTADSMLPQGVQAWQESKKLGNVCELYTAPGQPHAFFNKEPWLTSTVFQADEFLCSLGYLHAPSTLHRDVANGALIRYSGE